MLSFSTRRSTEPGGDLNGNVTFCSRFVFEFCYLFEIVAMLMLGLGKLGFSFCVRVGSS